jgi:NAD(P)-dependent dehydrogenase (short-subunit alcohol dehydrogenase family)
MTGADLQPASLFDLTGKVAVVTGGSRGLGRALVNGLAQAGADVVVASRKLDNCRQVAEEIERSTNRRALAVGCHVAYWDQCDRLVDTVIDHFGRIDVLVNNAGMSPLYPSLVELSEELFDKTLAVNLKGPFRLACMAAEHMAASGGGSIINVSSAGSLSAAGGRGKRGASVALPYGLAKAGLNMLTTSLAGAYAPVVRVNAVLPGSFWTDAATHWPVDLVDPDSILLARVGNPNELVGAVVYLASDASSYTTGALIRVDGGMG